LYFVSKCLIKEKKKDGLYPLLALRLRLT